MKFTQAIVRIPGRSLIDGITTAALGQVDYDLALQQHGAYREALRSSGLQVTVLPAEDAFPDSTFVEDVAVLAGGCAVITRPGAPSRQREVAGMEPVLRQFFPEIRRIEAPGSLEGGDVMRIGEHFYIGLSRRTNLEGASQLAGYLREFGFSSTFVPVESVLHLKTGVTFLGDNLLAASAEFQHNVLFKDFQKIVVAPEEAYAANCLLINEHVLVPAGCPLVAGQLERGGMSLITLDMSEFRKVDGGLTCLSLRF